jgi:uncharacterized protein YegL
MRQRSTPVLLFALMALLVLVTGSAIGQVESPSATLLKPENISCQGWERDTVLIGWKDTSTDEQGFKLERSDNDGAWTEIQTRNPDGDGKYERFKDAGTDTTHNLRYRIYAYEGSNKSPYSDICDNRRIYDPQNFRVFYGLRGTSDDCPLIDTNQVCLGNDAGSGGGSGNKYVDLQYTALQGSADSFFRLGFAKRADQPFGSLDKVPINVVWCDGGGCAGGGGIGLSPALMETPFNLSTRVGDPVAYMVALHELWHFLQGKYYYLNDPNDRWVIEGQARSVQDKICIGGNRPSALCFDDISTGYAGYVPEVNGYLSNPNRPINTTSYQAVLFWTYLTEKYGTSAPSDQTEAGMNLLLKFWEASESNPGLDGIGTINKALQALGHSETFRDIWKDFAVANYAKQFNGVAKYKYDDMAETGGAYNQVMLSLDEQLSLNESYVDTDESVYNWGAQYYQFRPDSDVPFVDIKVTQDSTNNLYYTVLGIRGSNIVYEHNSESRHLNLPLLNDNYDKVTVIVAGLENLGNYRIAINGTQPSLNLLRPTSSNKARVGNMGAPDKFMVQVEVVDGSGVPMAGINLDNFSFIVGEEGSGGVTVPVGNIINKFQLMGQSWFVLRAPGGLSPDGDGSPDTYRLTVKYGSALSDNEDDAVDYTPRNDADSVLLLDVSGSMLGEKLTSAKNAAKLFIDSWRSGDKFGLISFNSMVHLDMQVTNWTDSPSGGSRKTAFDLINLYTAGGGTRIGDSIWTGYTELQTRGDSGHDWALVLLSDGDETNPGTRTFDQAVNELVDASGKKPVIHTVAVGPDADRPRMQAAASRTGGTYQYVSAPAPFLNSEILIEELTRDGLELDLDAISAPQDIPKMGLAMDYRYRNIAADIIGQQQFFAVYKAFNTGLTQETTNITVESGAAEMVISLSWDGLMGSSWLRNPNGVVVPLFKSDSRHRVWRVTNPIGGVWTLEVNEYIIPQGEQIAPDAPELLPDYLIQATIKTDVRMDAFITTPHPERVPGQPVSFVASLNDNAPITAALVLASVEKPDGSTYNMWLWDDGSHNDGAAGDSVFGGTFHQTGQLGSYNVTIGAYGYSPVLDEYFYRWKVLSFHMARVDGSGNEIPETDTDGDGNPDDWEIFFQPWTNPLVFDSGNDPDNDGSNNANERQRGTHPGDPDTDDDGEADGTDPNPVDPAVPPLIQPPSIYAYPGDETVYVRYTITDTYQFVGLFRDEDDDMDELYTYMGQQIAPNLAGVFTDTLVMNAHQYCYVAAAIDFDGRRSTLSAPSCAVPNSDPLAPRGSVLINSGAQSTASPHVNLTLWASDNVDPEVHDFGPDYLPPADSASGVTEMMISNNPDFGGAAWEPYGTSKPWILAQTSGLASVFVKYMDAVGNISETYVATIWIGQNPASKALYVPLIIQAP